jgi:hypothetical protein
VTEHPIRQYPDERRERAEADMLDVHPEPEDTCRPVEVDGETIRVRGTGELTAEGQAALASIVRAAKAKMTAEAPDQIGVLQNRLRLAHQARRAKEHQLDDVRRALCDIGFMDDDDPYSHADLADVIRQHGSALEVSEVDGADADDLTESDVDEAMTRVKAVLDDPSAIDWRQRVRAAIEGGGEQ